MAHLDSIDHFIAFFSEDFPQFPITKNDVANPSQLFVRKYFSMMIQNITRMPHFKRLSDDQLEFLVSTKDGPYLENLMDIMNLYKWLKYVMERMGQETKVRLTDILLPGQTPRRTYVLMNAIYDFYTSCAAFDDCYEEMCSADNKSAHISQLKEEQSSLQKQLQQKMQVSANYSEKVANIKSKLAGFASENEAVQNNLKDLQAQEEVETKNLNQVQDLERKEQQEFSKAEGEKQYYESLIVSDEGLILENRIKLQEKKAKCSAKLQDLTKLSKENQTKIIIFDKILSLQETLNKQISDEVLIDNTKITDLRSLYEVARCIKKAFDSESMEESKISLLLKEKKGTMQELNNALALLQTDKDSVSCQWEQRLQKYRELQRDLQVSLHNWFGRVDIQDDTLDKTRREIEKLNKIIQDSTSDLINTHKKFKEEEAAVVEAALKKLETLKKKARSYCLSNKME